MKKFSIALPILALVLAIGASAFTMRKAATLDTVYWRFDSNSLSDAREGTQYTMVDINTLPSCDNGASLPCVIQTDASIDTQSELDTYLNATFQSDQDVVDHAFQTKSN